MNPHKKEIIEKRIEKTIKNLRANNMEAHYAKTSKDALDLVKEMLTEGCLVSRGGSETLKEIGVIDELRSGKYNFLDREREGITPEEKEAIHRDTFHTDFYLTSSNAITENGELYNVDANSNRVPAIIFGPKNVIVVAGYNKLVRDINDAILRVKRNAAPPNTVRLSMGAPCSKTGECISLKNNQSLMCDGCRVSDRICSNYVVSAYQRHKDRIKVIIVGEELGF